MLVNNTRMFVCCSFLYRTGEGVAIPGEVVVLNTIVLPHKELSGSYKNQIIL